MKEYRLEQIFSQAPPLLFLFLQTRMLTTAEAKSKTKGRAAVAAAS